MEQNIPTQEQALKIYLQNQMFSTRGKMIEINKLITRMQNDMKIVKITKDRLELQSLLEDEQLLLSNYQFRLDWLQNQLEEFKNKI